MFLVLGLLLIFVLKIDDTLEDEDNSSDEEFHYPGASPHETIRPASRTSESTDYFTRAPSRVPTDLTPQLSQALEFRVPTHEAPQKAPTPRWTTPTPHQLHAQWERDEAVSKCRGCQRRFTFLLRRHCRKCGRIFCDRCSSFRALLDPLDIVQDPALPETYGSSSSQRVCQTCFDEVNASVPSRLHSGSLSAMELIVVDEERLSVPGRLTRRESSSQLSDLADCPVCNQSLDEVGDAEAQEAHVKSCLGESALLGVECVICLEEFVKGSTVARLSCFCSFHYTCLSSWLQRGKSCPVHAR
ncbi:FYVE-domain-containing protein [Cyathus striatus]|nr:FYVE-domain-containing protein [Cyathus striatus]